MKTAIAFALVSSAIAFALVSSAAAFAPAPLARTATSLAGDARSPDGLGVDPGPLVDPLGLLEDTDGFARRRAVEITHGRICMLAFIGMMVQELGITFPGSIDLAGEVPFSSIGYGFDSNRGEGRRRCGGPGGRPGSPSRRKPGDERSVSPSVGVHKARRLGRRSWGLRPSGGEGTMRRPGIGS